MLPGLMVLSLASQATFWTVLAPSVPATLEGGLAPGQLTSFSPYGYDRLARQVTETARLCGIDASNPPPHLVVDETTYPVLAGS